MDNDREQHLQQRDQRQRVQADQRWRRIGGDHPEKGQEDIADRVGNIGQADPGQSWPDATGRRRAPAPGPAAAPAPPPAGRRYPQSDPTRPAPARRRVTPGR
ncbi:MAG: hypothetical protein HXY39_19560 [Chloroflexi bacterium]|nr:hypothetical protein [Chloroflexota bacterium]